MEDSFEQSTMEQLMEMLKELKYTVDRQNTKMDIQNERLESVEGELAGVSNRQSISEYEQSRGDTRVHSDRRRTLSGQILQEPAISQHNVIYSPQSFKLKTKLESKIGWVAFRDWIIEYNRFRQKEGNQNVVTYFFQEDYLNMEQRSFIITRIHLYNNSQRAKDRREKFETTVSTLEMMEGSEFLRNLECIFLSTTKDEYRLFFKQVVAAFQLRRVCKFPSVRSLQYLYSDWSNFVTIIEQALIANPESDKDTEQNGHWHPGLHFNRNTKEEGLLEIVTSWFPVELFRQLRQGFNEKSVKTLGNWVKEFHNQMKRFSETASTIHMELVALGSEERKRTKEREVTTSLKAGIVNNITENQSDEIGFADDAMDEATTVLSPLTDNTGEDEQETQPLHAISSGRPILKKDDARRLMATGSQKNSNKDLVCFKFLQRTCHNDECEYSHNTEDILKYLDETRRSFAPK